MTERDLVYSLPVLKQKNLFFSWRFLDCKMCNMLFDIFGIIHSPHTVLLQNPKSLTVNCEALQRQLKFWGKN